MQAHVHDPRKPAVDEPAVTRKYTHQASNPPAVPHRYQRSIIAKAEFACLRLLAPDTIPHGIQQEAGLLMRHLGSGGQGAVFAQPGRLGAVSQCINGWIGTAQTAVDRKSVV